MRIGRIEGILRILTPFGLFLLARRCKEGLRGPINRLLKELFCVLPLVLQTGRSSRDFLFGLRVDGCVAISRNAEPLLTWGLLTDATVPLVQKGFSGLRSRRAAALADEGVRVPIRGG
jgi:hypothetical protein